MKRFKYLALAALVAFAACDEGEDLGPGETDVITGTVTVAVTAEGSGVADVEVNLVGPTTASQTTPASGMVTFNNVEGGAYAVSISGIPSGFVCSSTSKTTNISQQGQTAEVSFSCNVIRTASISGQVTAGSQAVSGATIVISGPDGDEDTQTGAEGTYEFTGLVMGGYTVTLQEGEIGGVTCAETTLTRDLEPGESEVANFSCGGAGGSAASVAIERITTPAGVSVDRTMIAGMIVIQVGVDEGGQDVDTVRVWLNRLDDAGNVIDQIRICEQSFDEANPVSGGPTAVEEEFEIDCVVNTAAIRDIDGVASGQFSDAGDGNAFSPIFLNGNYMLVAEAIVEGGDNADAEETITLVNADRLALNVENTNPEADDFLIKTSTGLRWLSGSFTFQVWPIIYSAPFDPNNPAIARATFGFDSYVSAEVTTHFSNDTDTRPSVGAAAIPAAWNLSSQSPSTTDGSFTFSLPDTHLDAAPAGVFAGGVLQLGNEDGVDDLITGTIGAQNIRIGTITAFGQNGPGVICANISTTCVGTGATTTFNPLIVFYQGVLQSGTGATNNVLRADNQEPWAETIMLDPHPLQSQFPTPSAGIVTNGTSSVRGGLNFNGLRDGWLNHEYEFDAGMWTGGDGVVTTSGLGTVYAEATDAPNIYPNHPNFVEPAGIIGSTLAGIGLAANPLSYYAMASDASNSPSAYTITGLAGATPVAQKLRNVTTDECETQGDAGPCVVTLGEDLPGETGPGLDDPDLTPPNSNEQDDVSVVAGVIDLFANFGITNILEVGVDGQAPIWRAVGGAPGTAPTYPTPLGTVYNTYSPQQAANPSDGAAPGFQCPAGTPPNETCVSSKTRGIFEGSITDAGQGFSGAAGVAMSDWENGLATCCSGTGVAGDGSTTRVGVTLQLAAGLAPTGYLDWEWSTILASNTFLTPTGAVIRAYDASPANPIAMDGYRQQQPNGYDRAANLSTIAPTVEHIADKTRPRVGNVEMPTPTVYNLGQSYTFRGESDDQADLEYTDFVIDFNTITTIQAYADEAVGTPFAPGVDAFANPYVANPKADGVHGGAAGMNDTGNSLQLPLQDIDHTAFGSASILLSTPHSATAEFIGCIVLFDDAGAPAANPTTVHIPRGPRWRTWDHAYPYGLMNTQFNTFTPTSVPTNSQTVCANGMTATQLRARVSPSAGSGRWSFGLVGGNLELEVSGQSGSFVPGFDITAIDLYYIDDEGRARILDLSGTNWTGPFVEDVGTGATGRTYTWTYPGTLLPAAGQRLTPTGHDDAFFFVYRFGDGTALMWDDSAN